MPRQLIVVIGLLVGIIVVATVLAFTLGSDAASLFSNLATLGVMLGAIGYIVLYDSRTRWPELSARQRLGRLLSLKR